MKLPKLDIPNPFGPLWWENIEKKVLNEQN